MTEAFDTSINITECHTLRSLYEICIERQIQQCIQSPQIEFYRTRFPVAILDLINLPRERATLQLMMAFQHVIPEEKNNDFEQVYSPLLFLLKPIFVFCRI